MTDDQSQPKQFICETGHHTVTYDRTYRTCTAQSQTVLNGQITATGFRCGADVVGQVIDPDEFTALLDRLDAVTFQRDELARLQAENERLRTAVEAARDALDFYADPDAYIAIHFVPDPPCGHFMDDFDEDHGNAFYDRPMPGKTARAALVALEQNGEA